MRSRSSTSTWLLELLVELVDGLVEVIQALLDASRSTPFVDQLDGVTAPAPHRLLCRNRVERDLDPRPALRQSMSSKSIFMLQR